MVSFPCFLSGKVAKTNGNSASDSEPEVSKSAVSGHKSHDEDTHISKL